MNLTQSYNLKKIKTIATFFQPKLFNLKTHSYDSEPLITFLTPYDSNKSIKIYQEMIKAITDKNEITSSETIEENIKLFIKKNTKENFYKTLENLHKECEEEGFEVFDEKARQNARQILDFLCEKFPEHDFDIYPTENREIAICYTPCKGCSILVICDSDGSIAYFKILNGRKSRYRCQNITDFPFDQLDKEKEFEPKLNNNPTSFKNNKNPRILSNNNEYKIA